MPMSKELGDLIVKNCTPEEFKDEVDIVFSGLDSDVAGGTGKARMVLGREGVLTNCRNGFPQSQYPDLLEREELPPRSSGSARRADCEFTSPRFDSASTERA